MDPLLLGGWRRDWVIRLGLPSWIFDRPYPCSTTGTFVQNCHKSVAAGEVSR
jgi:hypothetical protein